VHTNSKVVKNTDDKFAIYESYVDKKACSDRETGKNELKQYIS